MSHVGFVLQASASCFPQYEDPWTYGADQERRSAFTAEDPAQPFKLNGISHRRACAVALNVVSLMGVEASRAVCFADDLRLARSARLGDT